MPRIILAVLVAALLVPSFSVAPVLASGFTTATEQSQASKRQHGTVAIKKEWDANTP